MYPFITIDLVNISEALDRAHRGGTMRPTVTGYRPPDMAQDAVEGRTFVTDWPMAMNLDYQITTWSRFNSHDRQILRSIWERFPGRYGSLGGNASPRVRPFSAQLLSMVPGDRQDESGKRQFRKIFTLRIFSELWISELREITNVTTLDISMVLDKFGISNIDCYES